MHFTRVETGTIYGGTHKSAAAHTITFLNLYALKMIYESKLLHLPVDLGTKKKIEIIHSTPKSEKKCILGEVALF